MTRKYGNSKCVTTIAVFALALSFYAAVILQAQSTTPKQVSQLLTNRFPQVLIGECNESTPLTSENISIQSNNGDIVIRGSDFKGNPWTAQMEISPMSECQVWTADLGNKQRRDLLILAMGTGSSGGWDSQLNLLLLDNNGRPFPWQAVSNFSADESGVIQVVKDTNSGTAQILVPKQDGDRSTGLSNAYNLFGVTDSRIRKITMSQGGMQWPLMVSPTREFIAEQQKYEPSTSAISAGSRSGANAAKVVIERIDNPESMQDEQLVLSTKKVLGFPKIVMIDRSSGERFIDFDPSQKEISELKSSGAGIQSLGVACDRGYCQPLIVWAEQ
jgi:hypothetical protein